MPLLSPTEKEFVSAVNQLFEHFVNLYAVLKKKLPKEPFPILSFVPAKTVIEAQNLLDVYFQLDITKDNPYKLSVEGFLKNTPTIKLDWSSILKESGWFRENLPPQMTVDDYLKMLNSEKQSLLIIQSKIQPSTTLYKSAAWCWANKQFTLPLILLTATVCTLFPYTVPIIVTLATLTAIGIAIATSETVRTFVENHKKILGGVLTSAAALLWLPVLGVAIVGKYVGTLFSWIPVTAPTMSASFLPSMINAVYATGVAIIAALTTAATALIHYVSNRKPEHIIKVHSETNPKPKAETVFPSWWRHLFSSSPAPKADSTATTATLITTPATNRSSAEQASTLAASSSSAPAAIPRTDVTTPVALRSSLLRDYEAKVLLYRTSSATMVAAPLAANPNQTPARAAARPSTHQTYLQQSSRTPHGSNHNLSFAPRSHSLVTIKPVPISQSTQSSTSNIAI